MTLTTIDLFAGAGGFTSGATSAGLNVVLAANHWPAAVDYHARNHPDVEHTCQDIRQMDFRDVPDHDVLLASPACQGHSTASQPRRVEKHVADRNTAWAIIECAEVKRPRFVVVENVASFQRWCMFDLWVNCLERLGYNVSTSVVDAADLGVPQNRKRLIVAGALEGSVDLALRGRKHRPVADVLEDSDTGWATIASKPVGVQRRAALGRERYGRTFLAQHTTDHRGRSLERPCGTVTCASGHWHLVDGLNMRPLTTRELARIQGFSDGHQLPSQSGLATRMIGNAIPPHLARWACERVLGVA